MDPTRGPIDFPGAIEERTGDVDVAVRATPQASV
jgi:hypothetical protein